MPDGTKLVDEYLEALPPDRKEPLTKLRELILQVAPEAVQSIQYRMPTFTVGESYGAAIASQKQYMSLYVDVGALARHEAALRVRGVDLGKSCIRFRRYEALPLDVVRIVLVESFGAPAATTA